MSKGYANSAMLRKYYILRDVKAAVRKTQSRRRPLRNLLIGHSESDCCQERQTVFKSDQIHPRRLNQASMPPALTIHTPQKIG